MSRKSPRENQENLENVIPPEENRKKLGKSTDKPVKFYKLKQTSHHLFLFSFIHKMINLNYSEKKVWTKVIGFWIFFFFYLFCFEL